MTRVRHYLTIHDTHDWKDRIFTDKWPEGLPIPKHCNRCYISLGDFVLELQICDERIAQTVSQRLTGDDDV